MPDKLAQYLPFLNSTEIATLYGDITAAAANPRGDPTREGVIKGEHDKIRFLNSC